MADGQKTGNYGTGPWNLKKNDINNFTIVTNENRKNAIVLGRILYVIEASGPSFVFKGTFTIDPCFTMSWWRYPYKPWMAGYPGHFRVFINSNFEYSEWASSNKYMIDKFILEKSLYIKPQDPILTFLKEDK